MILPSVEEILSPFHKNNLFEKYQVLSIEVRHILNTFCRSFRLHRGIFNCRIVRRKNNLFEKIFSIIVIK